MLVKSSSLSRCERVRGRQRTQCNIAKERTTTPEAKSSWPTSERQSLGNGDVRGVGDSRLFASSREVSARRFVGSTTPRHLQPRPVPSTSARPSLAEALAGCKRAAVAVQAFEVHMVDRSASTDSPLIACRRRFLPVSCGSAGQNVRPGELLRNTEHSSPTTVQNLHPAASDPSHVWPVFDCRYRQS